MLGWVAMVSGVGTIVVVLRWWRRRVDVLGRPTARPWFGGGVLAVVCLTSGTFALRHHAQEDRLSQVATTLAGRDVRVRCQGLAGAFTDANVEPGYVRFGPDGPAAETVLKPDICRSLAAYDRSPGAHPGRDQVVAVHILTHEAMHLAGIEDEAQTECAAVQRDAHTARLLGATPRHAAELALRYWMIVYPEMPDGYRSGACGPGGAYDERLADPPWAVTAART